MYGTMKNSGPSDVQQNTPTSTSASLSGIAFYALPQDIPTNNNEEHYRTATQE